MTDLRTAAQQALEALEAGPDVDPIFAGEAEAALRAALQEPVEEPWLRVIDEAMIDHHIGVADVADDYETAKRKLNILLCCAQDIGAYFAKQAKPVQEPDSPERRCGGPGCDGTCCQPVQEPVLQALADADRVMGHDDEATEWRERWKHLFGVAGSATSPWRESAAQGCSPGGTGMPAAPPQRPAEPQGCAHCNHPLYAAVKCKVCGRAT